MTTVQIFIANASQTASYFGPGATLRPLSVLRSTTRATKLEVVDSSTKSRKIGLASHSCAACLKFASGSKEALRPADAKRAARRLPLFFGELTPHSSDSSRLFGGLFDALAKRVA